MNLLFQFEKNFKEKKFASRREKILIACSGGPDSVALFHLMRQLPSSWHLRFVLAHFHHGLRKKSADADLRFVKGLARAYKIPFVEGRGKNILKNAKKKRASLEEAARESRYAFLIQTARRLRIRKVALAHHQQDQAETILMRMLQGTGLRGLAGIRETLRMQGMLFIRPLLPFSKSEILEYLKENRFAFRKDKSNQDSKFLRNRIRLKLMPWLAREFNPRVVAALARIPAILQDENLMLEELEAAAWKKVFRKKSKGRVNLNRETFLRFPAALQFRILNRALRRVHCESGLSFEAWERLRPELTRRHFTASLPKDLDLTLTPLEVKIYRRAGRG